MKSMLRFMTSGSVDDGKSTLIGRLLRDSGALPEDRIGDVTDLALIADGLEAEREQGITIDVAHLSFATSRRRFLLADAPGHEQYTRNMATGASNADAAIVLVDAFKGLLPQTRRHAYIARLLGIRTFCLAVNKMDLVGFDRDRFEAIAAELAAFLARIGGGALTAIPVSALHGDNVVERSTDTPWHEGPTLLDYLETVEVAPQGSHIRFRMPVQHVIRDGSFRAYAGTIAAGQVKPGDDVAILPSNRHARIERIVAMGGDLEVAEAPQSVALTFTDPIDCSRGDMIADPEHPPHIADQFEATLIWMGDAPLLPGRQYLLKIGTQTVPATVQKPKHKISVDTLEQLATKTLELNEIGTANVWTARPIVFESYEANRPLGGFILIDRLSGNTVAAGLIHFALYRAENVHAQALTVTAERRAALMGQAPKLLWFTGLSGAGKSTIANLVETKLHALGRHTFLMDGDNVRLGLNRDLGFTAADRVENIRRAGEAARLMTDAGLIVLAAFISPFRAERDMVRAMMGGGRFVEIFIDTPLEEAERRDAKGLYARARAGEIANFTGIASPYEPPERPEIRIDTLATSAGTAADLIVRYLEDRDAG
ncbi:adenylyl-sulfate kinase [Sphingosinicella sp. LHD-64]|uniref:adenylyl-sulfate kinase n=1 Tax=Sphingosinicella sp. LHD-64 TaxID=3072139 RepID=UPI00280F3ECD|nr:adenylyl-sulfate kinase [Sphingosinicella sp. LHD-64]MDQ8755416.1 adenylyl-sulfate kinase [Sphingosinicella sp. LHD-64]